MSQDTGKNWWEAVGPSVTSAVLQDFRQVLRGMPMTHKELATELEVDPSTVGRWSNGTMKPSLPKMEATVEAVEIRLRDLLRGVEKVGDTVDLVRTAVDAKYRSHTGEKKDERTDAWTKYQEAVERLREGQSNGE